MGLLYGENCVILASTVFDRSTRVTDGQTDGQTDRQTDGIAMAYTRYSIYAVAHKNHTYAGAVPKGGRGGKATAPRQRSAPPFQMKFLLSVNGRPV